MHLFVKRGDHGHASYLQMRRLIEGLTTPTLPRPRAHVVQQMLMIPLRIRKDAPKLVGRSAAPIHMKFLDDCSRIFLAIFHMKLQGATGHHRLTDIEMVRGAKLAQPSSRTCQAAHSAYLHETRHHPKKTTQPTARLYPPLPSHHPSQKGATPVT